MNNATLAFSITNRNFWEAVLSRASIVIEFRRAEEFAAIILSGIITFGYSFGGVLGLVWVCHPTSAGSALRLKALVIAASLFAVTAFIGNMWLFSWLKWVIDDLAEPLPFQVLQYLRAEAGWKRRMMAIACIFDVLILWTVLFVIESVLTLELNPWIGGPLLLGAQLALCFGSNSFLVICLELFSFDVGTLRRLWHHRFAFDAIVSIILWLAGQALHRGV